MATRTRTNEPLQTDLGTILDLQTRITTMGNTVLTGLLQGKTGGVDFSVSTETGTTYEIALTSKRVYSKRATTKKATTARKKTTRKKTTRKKTTKRG